VHPDQSLKCLLISPKFARAFLTFDDTLGLIGARAVAPPLGLITAAALLPQHWQFRLLDLNAQPLSEDDWSWADLICVGGMFPQKVGMLQVIDRARRERKLVAVGGADATSQPQLYADADVLVLGEGEASIPLWLDAWRRGTPRGVFRHDERPDVTKSPLPRFDLLRLGDYVHMSVQFSRGCPFTCEFCDVIETLGRVPRAKDPSQLVAELNALYELGFRGQVDIADDNLIGNKRRAKPMLQAVIEWSRARRHPFFFSTEASLNMADDPELLRLMRDAGFKYVFTGIETPDPDLLRVTKKRQNLTRPIVERVNVLYEHGLAVYGGFILGFDREKPGSDQAIIQCIEDTGICKTTVGLLIALPNTQLSRRLEREGRMLPLAQQAPSTKPEAKRSVAINDMSEFVTDSLNFIPTRDRFEILQEYANVLLTIHEPSRYMNRVLRTARKLRVKSVYRPRPREYWRSLRAAAFLAVMMTRDPATRRPFWRNVLFCLPLGVGALEYAMRHMYMYPHFRRHTELLVRAVDNVVRSERASARKPHDCPLPQPA
jgi:radical SAM superfamily enzyme YgiQ (UPF0313 family)